MTGLLNTPLWLVFIPPTLFPALCAAASSLTTGSPSQSTSLMPQQTHTVQVGLADHKFEPDVLQAGIGDVALTKLGNHVRLLKSLMS
jgi:hypothetical protein